MSVEFGPVHSMPSDELEPGSLLDTPLRVWVEIGRTHMPAASVVGMPEGAILDLDREADDPAELFVNGRHFGTGRLILVEGEWALRIESLDDADRADDADDADRADAADEVEHSSTAGQDDPEASD